MNKLSTEKRIQILNMLVEGSGLRSISRIMNVSINTVTKLLLDAGRACDIYHHRNVRNVSSQRLELDEIWSFCYAKAKTVGRNKMTGNPDYAGDVWLWTALDPDSKLIVSWMTSVDHLTETADEFVEDVAGRLDLSQRVQVSSDGWSPYHGAIHRHFQGKADYAQVVKHYTSDGRYDGSTKRRMQGNPDMASVSTSLMERHNLTTRMSLRRYNRKTNAHSKKLEHHYLSLALYFTWYNWIRIHSTIGTTPAVKAGLSKYKYEMEHILDLIDAVEYLEKHGQLVV